MRFAILMYADPARTKAMSRAEVEAIRADHEVLVQELTESTELVGGSGLALPEETTTLRNGPKGVLVESGPLAGDVVEQLTAYYEVECETAERAQEIAARTLDDRDHVTAVEVRRIHDTAG